MISTICVFSINNSHQKVSLFLEINLSWNSGFTRLKGMKIKWGVQLTKICSEQESKLFPIYFLLDSLYQTMGLYPRWRFLWMLLSDLRFFEDMHQASQVILKQTKLEELPVWVTAPNQETEVLGSHHFPFFVSF